MHETAMKTSEQSARREPARRVCIAYPFFPHYRQAVFEELLRRGAHAYTLMGDDQPSEPSIRAWVPTGVFAKVFRKARVRCIGPRKKAIYWQWGLVPAALDRSYDTLVIHSGVWWPTTWLMAMLGRISGKQIISWGHGYTRPENGLRGWLRRVYYKLYHQHMTYGHYGKVLLMQTGWQPEAVHVIYNSLDYAQQKHARDAIDDGQIRALRSQVLGKHESLPVAVCVTRLIAVRRLDLLLRAAKVLAEQGSPVVVLLVGDGPQRAELEKLATELGVACVFTGAIYDEAKIAKLVMMSQCMVAPGKVGLTAMTALAYGTPVVTHDDPDDQMPEWEAVIPGKTGSTFRKNDIKDLARAIGVWCRVRSEHERADTRRACIEIIEHLWNPTMQCRAVERCLAGKPANDLFWTTEADAQASKERG
jgi:glycosyltransferase involved in cell wall biosynthesis